MTIFPVGFNPIAFGNRRSKTVKKDRLRSEPVWNRSPLLTLKSLYAVSDLALLNTFHKGDAKTDNLDVTEKSLLGIKFTLPPPEMTITIPVNTT